MTRAARRLRSEEFAAPEAGAEAANIVRRHGRTAPPPQRDASPMYPDVAQRPDGWRARLARPDGHATAWGGPFATEPHAYRYLAETYLDN